MCIYDLKLIDCLPVATIFVKVLLIFNITIIIILIKGNVILMKENVTLIIIELHYIFVIIKFYC